MSIGRFLVDVAISCSVVVGIAFVLATVSDAFTGDPDSLNGLAGVVSGFFIAWFWRFPVRGVP